VSASGHNEPYLQQLPQYGLSSQGRAVVRRHAHPPRAQEGGAPDKFTRAPVKSGPPAKFRNLGKRRATQAVVFHRMVLGQFLGNPPMRLLKFSVAAICLSTLF